MNKVIKEGEFAFIEPGGHLHSSTKIERYWEMFNGPYSLFRDRIPHFSVYAGMSHSPMEYKMKKFEIDNSLPSDEWIKTNLKKFIRTEFSGKEKFNDFPTLWPPKVVEEIEMSQDFFYNFFEKSEWVNNVDEINTLISSDEDIAYAIYDLLCNSEVGTTKNKRNNDKEEFVKRILPIISNKGRILFVLLGFPFKDQNRFRVPYGADNVDFGEMAFMYRLYNLTQTLYQIHPYGVDIVVCSDGELYQDIFNVDHKLCQLYMSRLKYYRNLLNLQGAISFISLKDMISRLDDNSSSEEWIFHVKQRLKIIFEEEEFKALFKSLLSGIKRNMNTRNENFNDRECWDLVYSNKNCNGELGHIFNEKSLEAALKYCAVNLFLKRTNLVQRYFPDSIRGTVHPKRGQFGVWNGINSFVWNGIPFSKEWPQSVRDITIFPFHQASNYEYLKKVTFPNSNQTAFFTCGDTNSNIKKAAALLRSDGWILENLLFRNFVKADLYDFIEAGKNDPKYTWEREVKNEEYFVGLFEHRMSHYEKYGFGVQGVWLGGKLIGQFGLQVLDGVPDHIEVVILLTKQYRGIGLGKKLLTYVLSECKAKNIANICALIVAENYEALNLIEPFKKKRVRTKRHYGQNSILFNLI